MTTILKPTMDTEEPGATVGWFNVTKGIDVTTKAVFRDEWCWYLGEFELPSRSGKSKSRYQLLRVIRADRLATAYIYLGPAKSFTADQFQMIGGIVENGRGQAFHTVAELQDGADVLRGRPQRRELEPLDMSGLFQRTVEQKKAVRQLAYKGAL